MLEKNRDRGNIKWTAMMLPEHVAELRNWMGEDELTERPILNEWDLQLFQEEIEIAYKSKSSIRLTYWREGYLKRDYGTIISIDMSSRSLMLDDPFTTTRYAFDEITAVSVID